VALASVTALSCGSATPASPTAAAVHVFPQTIMIMDGQAVPEELTIAVGERVSFMNHDRTTYTVAGGREPSRPGCPEINVVGVLTSGDTRTTEPFMTAKTCEFHVPRDQSALTTGRIVIR
jgi:plastocyanin